MKTAGREEPPHALMLFLDGVGIGANDPEVNPFVRFRPKFLSALLGGNIPHLLQPGYSDPMTSFVPLSATLGVDGLPQSGTGQSTLLTGVNMSKLIGRHFGPHPYSTLKPLLAKENIFARLRAEGKSCLYANAFPAQYFSYLEKHPGRTTAITYAWKSAGNELCTAEDLMEGRALSADITGERWGDLGYPEIRALRPMEAGRRLVELTERHDFVFLEYYLTDEAGHAQSFEQAQTVFASIDGLVAGIIECLNPEKMLFLLTSDHGNLEDLSTKSHTLNPVPLLAHGRGHAQITQSAQSIADVTPALLRILNT